MPENFDPQESTLIGRYFTNLDKDIFCLVNLPEVVKGTLFSRYSRTEKTLRRVLWMSLLMLRKWNLTKL